MNSSIHSFIYKKLLIWDGGMRSAVQVIDINIQRDYLGGESCADVLARSRPDIIRGIHDSFLKIGVDAGA